MCAHVDYKNLLTSLLGLTIYPSILIMTVVLSREVVDRPAAVVVPTLGASPYWDDHNITAPGVRRSCPIGHHPPPQPPTTTTTTTTLLHLFLSSLPHIPQSFSSSCSLTSLLSLAIVALVSFIFIPPPKQSTPVASPPRRRFSIAEIAKQQKVNSFVFGL